MGREVPSHPGAGLQHAWLGKANAITPKVPLPPSSTSCCCWTQCPLGWDGPSVSEVSCPAVPPPLLAEGQVRGSTVLVLGRCSSAGTDTALHYQFCVGHKAQTQPLTSYCEKNKLHPSQSQYNMPSWPYFSTSSSSQSSNYSLQ